VKETELFSSYGVQEWESVKGNTQKISISQMIVKIMTDVTSNLITTLQILCFLCRLFKRLNTNV
jgi:hypothetical protein